MFSFTVQEIRDLIISAIVLAFLFGYPFSGCGANLTCFGVILGLLILVISTAFIFHELSHKFVAQYFGCPAGYVMWPQGLLFAILLKVTLGAVFAAPGAVMFYPFSHKRIIGKRENGLISLAGPMANVFLALVSYLVLPKTDLSLLISNINLQLAFFNLLPIFPLDGSKVFSWNKLYWLLAAAAIFLMSYGIGAPII